MRKREWDKTRTPDVKNDGDEPVENNNGKTSVGCSPPRRGKRRAVIGDLTPVESENAHAHAVVCAEQLVDLDIVGNYPADPGEA
jgi:hypothetical protein